MAATATIVCFMDCDGSFDAAELPLVVAPIESGSADLVLGARTPTERGAWPLHARVANRALASFMRHRSKIMVTDLGPMRAANREALIALGVADRRFGYPLEMVLRASRAQWTVVELPVSYAPRIGTSKVTGTLRGTVRAVRDMSKVARDLA